MAHVMGWLRPKQPMQQVTQEQERRREEEAKNAPFRREEEVKKTPSIRAAHKGPLLEEFLDPRATYLGVGILIFMALCIVPIWNALALLGDSNYRFFVGILEPCWIIALCVSVVALFMATSFVFVRARRPWPHTEQTMIIIANMFVMMLGLGLILVSLPISQQATDTFMNLMHNCAFSRQTQRLHEYSQVLHNIRSTPWCWGKYSVEDCPGYESSPPYTDFLKEMENTLQCSGFCYQPRGGLALIEEPILSLPKVKQRAGRSRLRHRDRLLLSRSLPQSGVPPAMSGNHIPSYPRFHTGAPTPPTLFSTANFGPSCEGMAARYMRDFAGSIGNQTYYQGIYLVVLAIVAGMANAIGTWCCRPRRDTKAAAKAKAKAKASTRVR